MPQWFSLLIWEWECGRNRAREPVQWIHRFSVVDSDEGGDTSVSQLTEAKPR